MDRKYFSFELLRILFQSHIRTIFRLKNNIVKIEHSLETILKLNGYQYKFNSNNEKIHYGFMAQDLEKILGLETLVTTSQEGLKSVNYIEIIPILLEAIKELSII